MIVIFNRRLGKIKLVASGNNQHIDNIYIDEAQDYKLIWDEIEVPDDNYVINNPANFRVNPDTKELEILPEAIPQYPIAAQ